MSVLNLDSKELMHLFVALGHFIEDTKMLEDSLAFDKCDIEEQEYILKNNEENLILYKKLFDFLSPTFPQLKVMYEQDMADPAPKSGI